MYSICIVINNYFCTSCKWGTLQLNPCEEAREHRLVLIQLYVLLAHYKNIMKMQYFGPCSLFGSPNVNAWYSHSVVTNTHTGSDRKTHIIEYTAVLTNRLCLPFIHHWLVQLYLPTTKKISFSALLCNVAFSVDNEHNAHGVGRAAINMDHGEDQKDSWLLVMFRSEKNNRDIRGNNNVWFSGHISKIRSESQFHWTDDIKDVSVNIYVFHTSNAWLNWRLPVQPKRRRKMETDKWNIGRLSYYFQIKMQHVMVIMVPVGLDTNMWLMTLQYLDA